MANPRLLSLYFDGITRQIRAEVDFINSLFEHQGLKGEGNELVLRDIITRFIPKRFGVGTGIVIDRKGNASRQCDIVIYDAYQYPALLAMTNIHMFPVDIVYAVVEVKTTLDAGSAKVAIDNINSVRQLDYIKEQLVVHDNTGGGHATFAVHTAPPLGIVFAYNTDAIQDTAIKGWFTPPNDKDTPLYPTLVCAIDIGHIAFVEQRAQIAIQPEQGMKPELYGYPFPLPPE